MYLIKIFHHNFIDNLLEILMSLGGFFEDKIIIGII
jgi:hypothetical protein